MGNLLDSLEPKPLWHYFLELSKIPRGSLHEREAAKWCAEQGRALGLNAQQDAFGNVLISKPGTPGKENRPGVCLQAHVDMVCEKNEGTRHDFTKDPIEVYQDGDLLKARGTTLGADNGIGVAMGLAVLASKDIAHGPIEVLITVEEETGLDGAANLQPGWLKSKYLINIDSEEDEKLFIGCAGGLNITAKRPVSLSAPRGGKAYRIKAAGLQGGHSGMEINEGRGNAVRVLALTLQAMRKEFPFELASIEGGNKHNAIPREAFATLFLDPVQEGRFQEVLASYQQHWKSNFGAFDPGVTFTMEGTEATQVISEADYQILMNTILNMPNGVESMSPDVPGLVQTSNNLGVLAFKGNTVEIITSVRSSLATAKTLLTERVCTMFAASGFTYELAGVYPGWQPNPHSDLVKLINQTHQTLYGEPMTLAAIHAGLECGLIGEKQPGMEMASIGPNQKNVHTPEEQVSISSTAKIWQLLKTSLENI